MSWKEIAPEIGTGRPASVSAAVRILAGDRIRVYLFFSKSLWDALGNPTRSDVLEGVANDAGKLSLVFGKGDYSVAKMMKGSARMALPALDCAPLKAFSREACLIEFKDIESRRLIINLPVRIWAMASPDARQLAPAPVMARVSPPEAPKEPVSAWPTPSNQIAPEPAGPAGATKARNIDAVEYLGSKGYKISRLAENRWSLQGDTVTKGEVVKTVNACRKLADLDPVAPDRVV